jgi:LPXTG-motif cell wall-anchored protein
MNEDVPTPQFARRDAWVFRLLGGFFLVFGVLVLIGLFWPQSGVEKGVTVASGISLLIIGLASLFLGKRRSERATLDGK